jgi:phosphoglycolate phosphatase
VIRPRLVMLDMDGTLIDSQRVILAAMAGAFAGAGHPMPPEAEVLAIVGLSLPEALTALAPHLPRAATEDLVSRYRESFVANRVRGGEPEAPLYPGARAALTRLAARDDTLLGVATGKARRGLDHVLAVHDLARYFVTTQTADAHPSKPHPSMLHAALADTGAVPDNAVMVGDTEFDIVMGRAAGFRTIGVAWGYHPRARLERSGADLVIDDFDALDAALEDLRALVP